MRITKQLIALLCLVASAAGQSTVPPGVPQSQRFLSPYYVTAGLIRAKLGYGGDLLAIEVNDGSKWELISTPADHRPQAQSEDGWGIVCGAAAYVDANGVTQRSIVQSNQSTARLVGTAWLPLNSRPVAIGSTLGIGSPNWRWESAWDCWDSVLGDTIESPMRVSRVISVPTGLYIRSEATFTRASGLPQFIYERWNAPYMVLDGDKILSLIVDGVETPVAAVPDGTTAQPPALIQCQASQITLRCRCGRWLVIRGEGWNLIRYWRPHAKSLIVTGIITNRPCVNGTPVSVAWELEAQ